MKCSIKNTRCCLMLYLMANTNTVGSAVIEVVTFVLTGTVETGVPLVEVRDGDTVSLGEVTTPAILGGNGGVLVTG